jgi:hypothetical protein
MTSSLRLVSSMVAWKRSGSARGGRPLDRHFTLNLSEREKNDLVEFLKSI